MTNPTAGSPTGPTGPSALEVRVLTEVFHSNDLNEARSGVATFADLVDRIGQHHPAPSMTHASPLRQAVQACLTRAWLRTEPAKEEDHRNLLGYIPAGQDRLLITDLGLRQLPDTGRRLIEPNALAAGAARVSEAGDWLFRNMLPYTPTPSTMGTRYDALAETLAQAIAAISRAAVAQGDYWTRHTFMDSIVERFDVVIAGNRS
jgi:hypothetical protein